MHWRLISYAECDPVFNMAADEAILDAHLAGEVPPTLRLYGWKPHAISIGYSQKITDEEINSIRSHGLDVVRRATGGRAVLHLNDLTYSFIGTSIGDGSTERSGFLNNSVASAYKQISEGLIEGILEFGVQLELGSSQNDYRTNYDCFRATTNADLQYAGKKMIGSAQLRRKNAVLQHGSILLNQAQNKMNEVYGDQTQQTVARHANLFDVLDKEITFHQLQGALQHGFSKAFDVELAEDVLTEKELSRIERLTDKYKVVSIK
ncbi:MAG TPA: biotin/lipoate A/B protein ligase family protein [Drouetiella sp.]